MAVTGYQIPIALTVDNVADLLEVHPETVRRMINKGEIRAVRVGRLLRVPRESLTEFLAGGHRGCGGMTAQRETGPVITSGPAPEHRHTNRHHQDNGHQGGPVSKAITVETRSRTDLSTVLDASAIEQVEAMIAQGWESPAAAQAWLGWVERVATAAADRAIAEVAWNGTSR